MDAERLLNIIILATVFGLVFTIWGFCVFFWLGLYIARIRKLQRRLGLIGKETDESKVMRLWRDARQAEGLLEGVEKPNLQDKLRQIANDAGWQTPIHVVVLGVCGVAILAFVFTLALGGNPFLGLSIAIAVLVLFWNYTRRRITKRAALFERQLVDALGIAARSLRAGHPLVGAFQLIAAEVKAPLGTIFARISQEQSLGLDLRDSIRQVARRSGNSELKLFATAVTIQMQSGGNLADLMDSLAAVIRARIRLNRRVRVLTAQTQFSAQILIALPILLFIFLYTISPTYMGAFFAPGIGRYLFAGMIISVILGWWVMKRLAILRY